MGKPQKLFCFSAFLVWQLSSIEMDFVLHRMTSIWFTNHVIAWINDIKCKIHANDSIPIDHHFGIFLHYFEPFYQQICNIFQCISRLYNITIEYIRNVNLSAEADRTVKHKLKFIDLFSRSTDAPYLQLFYL